MRVVIENMDNLPIEFIVGRKETNITDYISLLIIHIFNKNNNYKQL